MYPKQQKLSLKNRALRYLSLCEHSRLELGRKLARYAEEGEDVEAVLDFLEKNRFLSCERFSESLIRRRSESYGDNRILAELQTHGLDSELLKRSKAELAESEVARARVVWQKKFGNLKEKLSEDSDADADVRVASECTELSESEQRVRQMRYLAQRGFSSKAIKAALSGNYDELDGIE
jgi:regulatory protein